MRLIVEKSKEKTKLPHVMRTAISLFVKKGIHGTTIKDIAQKSRVSEGALYRHFKSKEDLAWYLFSTHLNAFSMDLTEKLDQDRSFKEKIKTYVSNCLKAFEEEQELFTYLIISEHYELSKYPTTHVHPGHVALKLIEKGQKTGDLRKMNAHVGASILLGTIIHLCVSKIYGGMTQDLRCLTETVWESLWKALKK